MRFKGLDLNLLVALQALLKERSVSRTAEQLNLSQPAISAALGRLREFFDDELLVSLGRQMIPTPYAELLRPVIADLLSQAERLIATSSSFDPAISQRRFRVGASDFITTVLLIPLLNRLEQAAPGIQIDIIPSGDPLRSSFARGEIDLIIAPEQYASVEHPMELVFADRHVVVGWQENPLMQEEMTRERFFQSGHIAVIIGPEREPSFAERHLSAVAEGRRIEVTTTHFSSVPWMLNGTWRLAVLQERLARAFSKVLPLTIHPLPFDIPPLREIAQYHQARGSDTGVRWLLDQIHQVAGEFQG